MEGASTTLTERGQVSVPASIRQAMELRPGQELVWRKVSEDEVRVRIVRRKPARGVRDVIGCVKKLHEERGWPTRTDKWLRMLRAGETTS